MRGLIKLTLWPFKASLYLMLFIVSAFISFVRVLCFKGNDF